MKRIIGFLAVVLALAAPVVYADRDSHHRGYQQHHRGHGHVERHRAPVIVVVPVYRGRHYAPQYRYYDRAPRTVVVYSRYEYWRHGDLYYGVECRGPGIGIIVGAVVGGVLGNVVGDLGAVLGGIGGAVVGREIESDLVCR